MAAETARADTKRYLFLNQYFPPDPAPTGILLREIADELVAVGHEVDFVAAGQEYRAMQGRRGRIFREARALWRMFVAGRNARRPDVVVAGSSPPMLAVVAELVAQHHRAKAVPWTMDLYPEVATALGEIPEGWPDDLLAYFMGCAYRCAAKVVSLDEDMSWHIKRYGVGPKLIRPWVYGSLLARPFPAIEPASPWTWIYSGNMGRAHEWLTLLQAQAIIEQRDEDVRLLFQGGGPERAAAQRWAAWLKLQRCDWQPYAEENDLPAALLRASVCAATQRPEAIGCLWPSKLALLLALPRPILWIGPTEGAIVAELRKHSHAGIFEPGDARGVAEWLLECKRIGAERKTSPAVDPRAHRKASLAAWVDLLVSVAEGRKPGAQATG